MKRGREEESKGIAEISICASYPCLICVSSVANILDGLRNFSYSVGSPALRPARSSTCRGCLVNSCSFDDSSRGFCGIGKRQVGPTHPLDRSFFFNRKRIIVSSPLASIAGETDRIDKCCLVGAANSGQAPRVASSWAEQVSVRSPGLGGASCLMNQTPLGR